MTLGGQVEGSEEALGCSWGLLGALKRDEGGFLGIYWVS